MTQINAMANAKVLPHWRNEPRGSDMPRPPPLILLVEDEPEISRVISDILDDAGFRIEVASNYADGVVLLNASQPALLIANVLLPGVVMAIDWRRQPAALACQRCWSAGVLEVDFEQEARGIPFLAEALPAFRIETGDPNPHRKGADQRRPRSGGRRLTITSTVTLLRRRVRTTRWGNPSPPHVEPLRSRFRRGAPVFFEPLKEVGDVCGRNQPSSLRVLSDLREG